MSMKYLALGAIALALTACQQAPAGHQFTAADSMAIDSTRDRWAAAYNAGDMAAVAALFTDDAVDQPGDAPAVTGRAAIQQFLAGMHTQMPARIHIAPATRFEGHGDMAIAAGPFHMMVDSATTLNAKYLVVFKRQADGKWLLAYDANSMDAPPPASPPAPPARRR